MIETVKFAGVEQRAFFSHCGGADVRLAAVQVQHDRFDRQIVFSGELPVALVVRRHRHYRAGAIFHQHEVRDPYRHLIAAQRVDGKQAGRHAFFLHGGHFRFRHLGVAAFSDKVGQHGIIH